MISMYNTQFAKEHEERGGGIYEISGEFHGSRINWKGERGERGKRCEWRGDSFHFRAFSRAFARSFSRVAR